MPGNPLEKSAHLVADPLHLGRMICTECNDGLHGLCKEHGCECVHHEKQVHKKPETPKPRPELFPPGTPSFDVRKGE